MNEITAGMRLSLMGIQDDLKHLLAVGIENIDWYHIACECFVLLNNIEENERTPTEISQRQRLFELTYEYEREHYPI